VNPRQQFDIPLPGGRVLELGRRPLVMGILNVTPDSFADSQPHTIAADAIDAAARLEAAGADIIDIGGESTRPGADPVPVEEELARVLPVIGEVARRVNIPISIDTYKAAVGRAALAAGAVMVNDISGLQFEPELGGVAAEAGAAVVLMHIRGRPRTMNDEAVYGDVMADVIRELRDRIAAATAAGIGRERIILDPGVGIAKRASHSYGVLARFNELAAALGRPVLVGPSRKSFMREVLGDRSAAERDWGTAAAVAAAVLNGAHIVRVHNVAHMVQVVRVAEEIRKQKEVAGSR
jgi:dihydropteroate synthase